MATVFCFILASPLGEGSFSVRHEQVVPEHGLLSPRIIEFQEPTNPSPVWGSGRSPLVPLPIIKYPSLTTVGYFIPHLHSKNSNCRFGSSEK